MEFLGVPKSARPNRIRKSTNPLSNIDIAVFWPIWRDLY
jgi:hypothetical protein